MKHRKMKRSEWDVLQGQVWAEFLPRLEAVKSFADVLALLRDKPMLDSPGRSYFANLGSFMQFFTPPLGASNIELAQYSRIFQCIAGELQLSDSVVVAIDQALGEALFLAQFSEAQCA